MSEFRNLSTLGHVYGREYGKKNPDGKTDAELLSQMNEAQKANCLLSSLVTDLGIMRVVLSNIFELMEKPKTVPVDEPSDGMLKAFFENAGETPIEKAKGFENLGVREKRAIKKSGVVFVSDICRDRLENIRGCGVTTIHSLMLFRQLNDDSYEFDT